MVGSVTFTPTQAGYVAASRANYLVSLWSPRGIGRLTAIVFFALLLLCAFDYFESGQLDSFLLWMIPVYAVLVPLGIGINLLWLPRKVRRMFAQQPAYAEPMTLNWSDEGFSTKSPITTHRLRWSQLVRTRENASSFLFYITDTGCVFAPKRVLDEAALSTIRARAPLA